MSRRSTGKPTLSRRRFLRLEGPPRCPDCGEAAEGRCRPCALRRALAASVAAATILAGGCQGDAVVQPLPFNHRIHKQSDVACDACHEHAGKRTFAGLPKVEVCMGCHESDITENPSARPHIELLRAHARAGTELPWQRLYVLPKHVYYSHRRHTALAKLECPTCHGAIGDSEAPPERPVATTIDMRTCMRCHQERGIDNDCAWCHR